MPCRLQEGPFDERTFVTARLLECRPARRSPPCAPFLSRLQLIELAGMSLVTFKLIYSGRVLSLKNMSASAPGSPNHFTYER